MRRTMLSTVGIAVGISPILVAMMPAGVANAHGYVSSPASRQAQCAQGVVACGEIKYEPQSVEGTKGLRSCSGGVGRFSELDDDGKGWQVHSVGRTVSFSWQLTAQHRTANWEYYIGNTRVGLVEGNNAIPSQSFSHSIDLGSFTGRQKLLAIWNIGDTAAAFYSCIDLDIGGSGTPTTTKPSTTTPPATTNPPTTTRPPSTTNPPETTTTRPPATTTRPPSSSPSHTHHPTTTQPNTQDWQQGATYAIGDVVSYKGVRYRCLQTHKVYDPNWAPPNTPALWQRL